MNPQPLRMAPAAILLIAGSTQSLAAGPFGATFELSSLDGANGFVINGIDPSDHSGISVSNAGDVNGDGFDDVIIGADYAAGNLQFNAGESYVVFGSANPNVSGMINLSELEPIFKMDPVKGVVILGADRLDRSGKSVSNAGDINGDGFDDLIIGAFKSGAYNPPDNGQYGAGRSFIVFGAADLGDNGPIDLSLVNGSDGFVIKGIDGNDYSGWSVSSAGDVNADGADDLLIGAIRADPNGQGSAGETYVVFGSASVGASGTIELALLDGSNGFVINGTDTVDRSGVSVSNAGDINGDGVDDLVIGAYLADPNGLNAAGETYVLFGAVGIGSSGVLNLNSLNGTNGFVCNGIISDGASGYSVAAAGDINSDGVDDLIIGTKGGPSGIFGQKDERRSHVVFGAVGIGATGALELASLNGTNGFEIDTTNQSEYSGASVSSAGDINGDGVDDLIIGAWRAYSNDMRTGASYVIFGSAGIGANGVFELLSLNGVNGLRVNGIAAGDRSGSSVSNAGDINGDGTADLIIGAPNADQGDRSFAGQTYIVFGRLDCPGDLNLDGAIDTADLGALIAEFGTPGPNADINGDGAVDTADLGILIAAFDSPCP